MLPSSVLIVLLPSIRRHRPAHPIAWALTAGLFLVPAERLSAQAIAVTAVDATSGAPIPGALLDLRDATGHTLSTARSTAAGRRLLPVPAGGGVFRIRIRRVGYRFHDSAPVSVGPRDTVALVLRVRAVPVSLPVVASIGETRCDLDRAGTRQDAAHLATLWEQLRTALGLTELTRADGGAATARDRVHQYVTRLPAAGSGLRPRHTVLPGRQAAVRPLATLPPDELSEHGYVRYGAEGAAFVAPDEHVLLSDRFVADHCFRLEQGRGETAGLVGLAFTPAPDREVPEIAGVLWADTAGVRLRFLEFWFVDDRLPPGAGGRGRAGGTVHFADLGDGRWVTSGWTLRLPQLVRPEAAQRAYTLRFVEVGAVVAFDTTDAARRAAIRSATPGFRRLAASVRPGAIALTVLDAPDGHGLPGATVELRQLPETMATLFEGLAGEDATARGTLPVVDTAVVTGPDGCVHVAGLPPGRYELRFGPEQPRAGGVEPPAVVVTVAPDSTSTAGLAPLPSVQLGDMCRGSGTAVYGVVLKGEGYAPPDALPQVAARVYVRWRSSDGRLHEKRTATGSGGRYRICDVPRDVPLWIQAEMPRETLSYGAPARTSEPVTVRLGSWRAAYQALLIPLGGTP
ncbi:MAG TPA: carboxypeptidase regulatory-like domain-containing protein [Gemmatimonadaceae bacterium]|nr:carboxypeptidase regulatory-like domain-containing protein [Gemmatimonadaceae bacterium]